MAPKFSLVLEIPTLRNKLFKEAFSALNLCKTPVIFYEQNLIWKLLVIFLEGFNLKKREFHNF